ncbi:TraB/GumN family protein [Spirochaeta africana]|uniref:GumN protein n=1 Tax=Spirochaeta africana (strain ATCC 700263 / DSM 8902 / Z-7692) TaxID=889378 RepID=H9UIB9_SPIAZ|nr:TraB/GumN family protein [Spirochaeta africana]AFG37262.1 hypothetical protein Spiaf_1183 [Spirochaeta africana DSM 8902]
MQISNSRRLIAPVYAAASLLMAVLLLSIGCATDTDDRLAEPRLDDDRGELFLWSVAEPQAFLADGSLATPDSAERDTGVLHIYGSIHLATRDVYPLPDIVYSLFENSDVLVLEIDLAQATPNAFFGLQSLMEYPDGSNLEDDLNEHEIELLSDTLGSLGIPFDMVRHLKPWVLEATLVTSLAEQQGIKAEYGIDMHFAELAADLDIPVIALETIEEQLGILGNLPTSTQAAELMRSIENFQDISGYIAQLLTLWRTGDLTGMEEVIAGSMRDDPELATYYDSMFVDRNRAWIPPLREQLAEGKDVFVVVGAGHLVGPDNVIELLRAEGLRAVRY